ncbi:hypothetical protein UP10_38750 [Bradyrhizobium sp. LTSPM299]|uniref:hypothetical protein n=1 Tax=Bradyrhizobium sp. LTSPM299 TaxID=1619233 RepID=UPI0005CA7901|nr:hypothetical protein [Bradyrhizobium sp. LTSPM299]KJC55697.1 hypothetical protein UP10_38750 [Bradyrhizobium sp. LTSPM299]
MTSAAELKRLIGQRKAITVPGTANALFARVIQDLGYEIVYVTGAGVANKDRCPGRPDSLRGAYAALGSLKKEGDLSAAGDLLASFEER